MSFRPGPVLLAILVMTLLIGTFVSWRLIRNEKTRELVSICLIAGIASLVSAGIAAICVSAGTSVLESSPVSSFELQIDSDMQTTDTGYRSACLVKRDGKTLGVAYVVCTERLSRGTRICCVGRFSAPQHNSQGIQLMAEGYLGSIRVVRILDTEEDSGILACVSNLRDAILHTIKPSESDSQALIAALSLGWRDDFKERQLSDLFSICGISHVAAVSGAHVSIVCALLASILGKLHTPIRAQILALVVLSGLYVLMSGASASGIRAWVMALSALLARLSGRRSHALSALSLCGLFVLLIRPGLSGNVGFLLSLGCVGSLCVFGGYAGYAVHTIVGKPSLPGWVPSTLRIRISYSLVNLCRGLGVSLVASMVALPIAGASFGRVSIIGPLVNALLALPISVLVVLSVLCAATCWIPVIQIPLLTVSGYLADALLWFLRMLAHIPGASVAFEFNQTIAVVCILAVFVPLYLLWPNVNRTWLTRGLTLVASLGLIVFFRWRFFAPARLCVLDVGQGDAILIQEGASAVLIDAGPDASVLSTLASLNVVHLDAVILTHLHDDHYGGVFELYGQIGCDAVYVGKGAKESIPDDLDHAIDELCGREALELSCGSVICVGNFKLELLWPLKEASGSENEDSLVMSLNYQNDSRSLSGLLTGDAEHGVLEACERVGLLSDIDVLKVGHHGSEVSLSDVDARILKPELALVSAGWNNPYGHPSDTCVRTLEKEGAIVLCTKDVGTIIVEPGDGVLSVHETGASHEVE